MSKAQGIANSANQGNFKNRIINGAMMIDQRNAGASVALPTSEVYGIDRFIARFSAGSYSITQSQSSVAPTGFKNSLFLNVTTGGTAASSVRGLVATRIEGYNFADFGYGASGASTFTMSFWVRSSLTGTFSGSFQNIDVNRSYVFTYSVNSANTWEQKTITVAGDTTGTWNTTNGIGIAINFDLGNGSDLKTGTTGSWIAGDYRGATGSVAPFTSSGATFYITGVQLEKGSTATSFDYRPYGTELQLCQRYYQTVANYTGTSAGITNGLVFTLSLTTSMRTNPTLSVSGALAITNYGTASFTQSSGQIQYENSLTQFLAHQEELNFLILDLNSYFHFSLFEYFD
jgi:hypothetical protein